MRSRSSAVGFLRKGPFSHGPGPQGAVADVGGEVDAFLEAIDGIEVLRKGLKAPVDAFGQCYRVDVLGSLKVADHQGPLVGPDRRQGETAVAHHRRRHPVPTRAAPRGVPEDLGVHVGVPVDEARGDDMAVGVDLFGTALGDRADRSDATIDHADIGPKRPESRTVHDGSLLGSRCQTPCDPPPGRLMGLY